MVSSLAVAWRVVNQRRPLLDCQIRTVGKLLLNGALLSTIG